MPPVPGLINDLYQKGCFPDYLEESHKIISAILANCCFRVPWKGYLMIVWHVLLILAD